MRCRTKTGLLCATGLVVGIRLPPDLAEESTATGIESVVFVSVVHILPQLPMIDHDLFTIWLVEERSIDGQWIGLLLGLLAIGQ
uniref:Uncharacterized protein n=1 Tax=Romanomermis culicivorax TaxID=13658 RepID=A0A915IQA4_ROMCU